LLCECEASGVEYKTSSMWLVLYKPKELCEVKHVAWYGDIVPIIADVFVLPPKLLGVSGNDGRDVEEG
jgi:hypothetical protein